MSNPERPYPLPPDEAQRLQALHELELLDSADEEAFDHLTRLASLICEVPISVISLVDDDRQWFKSRVGLEARETTRDVAFCTHAILANEIFEIPDAQLDPRFCNNPLVTGDPNISYYAGMPLHTQEGYRVGTLCVIDHQPRLLTAAQRESLALLGALASRQLELRKAALANARQAALQQALLNSAGCAMLCTSRDGLLTYLNPTAQHLLEADDSLLGQRLTDLIDPRELQGRAVLLGAPSAPGFDVLIRPLEQAAVSSQEWTLRRHDGRELPATLTLSAIRDESGALTGYLSLIQDLSELQQVRQRLQKIAEQVPGMLYQFVRYSETDFHFAYASEGIRALYNISPQQAMHQPQCLFQVVATEDIPRIMESMRVSAENLSPWREEYRVVTAEGGVRWLEGRALPQPIPGGVMWNGFISDISERKKIEHLKSEFVSTVSHELRTPLTSVSGALGLVVNGALGEVPAAMREMLQIAYQNSQRLSLLINDLLDMEKLEAGKMLFDICRQQLLPLLQEALDSNREYASRYAVTLRLEGSHKLQVAVDRLRLQQVLSNLLSNAAKFAPPGSEVLLTLSCENQQAVVSVHDHGQGIPEAFQPRIFQKFAQADSSDSRQGAGTGLGLALSREMIERMGGTIGFRCAAGQGTTFWISLPLAD